MKKTSNYCNKKSLTLIEIILALIVSSVILFYVIKEKQQSDFRKSISTMSDTIVLFLEDYVINKDGYASNRGGNCSNDYDYLNITSQRVVKCLQVENIFDINDNGNYITGDNLMKSYGGCRLFLKGNSNDRYSFSLYMDCSKVEAYDKRDLIEDRIKYTLENSLKYMQNNITSNAIDINGTTILGDQSGTSVDGKILFELKL